MISVSERVPAVKGLCGILTTGRPPKNNAAEQWKKNKIIRINKTIAIEAKGILKAWCIKYNFCLLGN